MSTERYLSEKPWSHGVSTPAADKNWTKTFGEGLEQKNCAKCGFLFRGPKGEDICKDCKREDEKALEGIAP